MVLTLTRLLVFFFNVQTNIFPVEFFSVYVVNILRLTNHSTSTGSKVKGHERIHLLDGRIFFFFKIMNKNIKILMLIINIKVWT